MTNRFKNKTKHLKYIILLFIVGALRACDKQTVYHAFRSVPQEGWKRQDTLFFDVAVHGDAEICCGCHWLHSLCMLLHL